MAANNKDINNRDFSLGKAKIEYLIDNNWIPLDELRNKYPAIYECIDTRDEKGNLTPLGIELINVISDLLASTAVRFS